MWSGYPLEVVAKMKCGYTKCKLGGEVAKEEAVKVGARYFHKECDNKREIKSYCSDKLLSLGMIPKLTNIFLTKIVDDENCDTEYLKFVMNYIIDNKSKLSNPYGVKYYMGDWKIEKLYSDKLKIDISKAISGKVECDIAEESTFTPPQSKIPNYLKII